MIVFVRVHADCSPAVLTRVKALMWRIIHASQGVLTHPSGTQGATGGLRGVRAGRGVKGVPYVCC